MKYEELPEGMKDFIFLLEFLKDIPEEKIDLSRWAHPCGTIFCAAGWATQIPRFRTEGLSLYQLRPVLRTSARKGEHHEWTCQGTSALATLFGRPLDIDLHRLFFNKRSHERNLTDKEAFFLRAQNYLSSTFNYDWTWK